MPFSHKTILFALGAAMLHLATIVTPAQAQDAQNRSVLDLLRGTGKAGETDRRVPFGREEMQLSFAPLVARTAPAVVNVYASQQARQVRSPFEGDPFFERFFGQQMRPRQQSSLGSGVMVDASGIVVTNYHVIKDADQVKVALSDGREFESQVLLKEEEIDLAVLKIKSPQALATIRLGDSDALQIGDLVLAIGNPFGVGQTTTSGIVSALARSHIGVSDFGFFIQTDAAINPGNSGGALVNMRGEVIGINTAIFSRSGGSIGIGFAIPSNMVRAVVAAAKSGADHFERPYIGATFEPVTAQVAEALGMVRPLGAIIAGVAADGPASKSGLKPGDVVLRFNGGPIEHVDALGYRLATSAIGSSVRLDVLRKGREGSFDVILARTPAEAAGASVQVDDDSPFAGVTVSTISPAIAQRLRVRPDSGGVAITEIKRGSAAEGVGFQPGDIIRAVNGEEITTPARLAEVTGQGGRFWRFTIVRGGRTINQVMRF